MSARSVSYGLLLGAWLLAAVLTAHASVARPWVVLGPSMEPTLQRGDRLVVDRWTLRHRPPRLGELVLLRAPDGRRWVKRVSRPPVTPAFPGEAIWVLGDNPARSLDSREFGPVSRGRVEGRVVLRYWPLERAGRPDRFF